MAEIIENKKDSIFSKLFSSLFGSDHKVEHPIKQQKQGYKKNEEQKKILQNYSNKNNEQSKLRTKNKSAYVSLNLSPKNSRVSNYNNNQKRSLNANEFEVNKGRLRQEQNNQKQKPKQLVDSSNAVWKQDKKIRAEILNKRKIKNNLSTIIQQALNDQYNFQIADSAYIDQTNAALYQQQLINNSSKQLRNNKPSNSLQKNSKRTNALKLLQRKAKSKKIAQQTSISKVDKQSQLLQNNVKLNLQNKMQVFAKRHKIRNTPDLIDNQHASLSNNKTMSQQKKQIYVHSQLNNRKSTNKFKTELEAQNHFANSDNVRSKYQQQYTTLLPKIKPHISYTIDSKNHFINQPKLTTPHSLTYKGVTNKLRSQMSQSSIIRPQNTRYDDQPVSIKIDPVIIETWLESSKNRRIKHEFLKKHSRL